MLWGLEFGKLGHLSRTNFRPLELGHRLDRVSDVLFLLPPKEAIGSMGTSELINLRGNPVTPDLFGFLVTDLWFRSLDPRSSSREGRIRVPTFCCRGFPSPTKGSKGTQLRDLGSVSPKKLGTNLETKLAGLPLDPPLKVNNF